MKRFIYSLILIISAVLLQTSCIKEVFPTGGTQTQAQVSGSREAMLSMIKAIPANMTTSGTVGYASAYGDHGDFGIPGIHLRFENMLEDLATMADNPYYNRFYAYAMNNAQGYQYTFCSYFWDAYYSWIRLANDVIMSITPVVDMNSEDPDDVEMRHILSLAYAYRAMCYLDMARLYEPKPNKYTEISSEIRYRTVPIVDEKTTLDQTKNNPRATRKQIYDFILSDLDKAEKLSDQSRNTVSEPNIYAIYGLKARTYIELGYDENGDYDSKTMFKKAIEYADKVIDGPFSPLTQTQWEDPVNGFNNASANDAWVWCFKLSSENLNNLLTFISHASPEAAWGYARQAQYGVSMRLYDQIPDTDFRKHSWLDPQKENYYKYKFAGDEEDKEDFLYGKPAAKPYTSLKFRPAMSECSDFNVGNPADYCLMRVEEMYFIKMEAKANLNLSEGVTELKEFMTDYRDGSYNRNPSSLKDFNTEMLLQKRIEFWCEGILLFDYKRLNASINRAYPGSNHPAVYQCVTDGRSPQWNIVITRVEFQSNVAINKDNNNPDPSGLIHTSSDSKK